jgi:hypothetical protein
MRRRADVLEVWRWLSRLRRQERAGDPDPTPKTRLHDAGAPGTGQASPVPGPLTDAESAITSCPAAGY